MKEWKEWNDECPECGNSPCEVYTELDDGFAHDGETVRCFECGEKGCVNADEEKTTTQWDNWG